MLQLLSLIPESSVHEEAQPGDRDFSAWVSLWKKKYNYHGCLHLTRVLAFKQLHINISMHILHTVLSTFLKVPPRRICKAIKSFFFFFFYYHGCLYLTIVLAFKQLHLNISMHILHTVLSKFLKVLIRRIWKAIKSFFCWRTFPLWLWP